jgi:3-methylcrotonyl-CoA carboxylase alpha subunit
MKRYVNGTEAELIPGSAEVIALPDRLAVRTASGMRTAAAYRQGDSIFISYGGNTYTIEKATRAKAGRGAGDGDLRAPMPGLIVEVLVQEGQPIAKGDKVLVLEAMKTQQAFLAPFDGVVASIQVSKGDQVADGQQLAVIQPEEKS